MLRSHTKNERIGFSDERKSPIKSNKSTCGQVRWINKSGEVPSHLRDAHYPGVMVLRHGSGYKYSHDYPVAISSQEYMSESLHGTRYCNPGSLGAESGMEERLQAIARRHDPQGGVRHLEIEP